MLPVLVQLLSPVATFSFTSLDTVCLCFSGFWVMYLLKKCLGQPGPSRYPPDNSGIWRGWPPLYSPNSIKEDLASPWTSKTSAKISSSLPHFSLPSHKLKIYNHMCFSEHAKVLKPSHIIFSLWMPISPLPQVFYQEDS